MGERSNVPRWICVTGRERGASSARRTEVNAERPDMTADSGAWKAGVREGIMLGVRTRIAGFWESEVVGW